VERNELIEQTKLAFDFIQKLYFEVSYMIKEVEGLLAVEDPPFNILRPSGYKVNWRSSSGLESFNVNLWPMRKLSVAFGPKEKTPTIKGQTNTKIEPDTTIIYLRIILDDKEVHEPRAYFGVLYDFHKKNPANKWLIKIEQLMQQFEYNESNFFTKPGTDRYEDSYVRCKGKLMSIPLYEINSSEIINKKVIQPVLESYRKILKKS